MQAPEGVSAVNAKGDVLLFLEPQDWGNFEAFVIGRESVSLLAPERPVVERRYKRLTVETLRASGRLTAIEMKPGGHAGRTARLEVARGR